MRSNEMKYIFRRGTYLMMLLSLVITAGSCKKDNLLGTENSTFEIAEKDQNLVFLPELSTLSIGVKTEIENLEIKTTQDWCTANYNFALKNIQIEVLENASLKERNATVNVSYKGVKKDINVTQFGIEPSIIISKDTIVSNYQSKIIITEVYSNVDIIAESKVDWIKEASGTRAVTLEPAKYTFNLKIDKLSNADGVRHGVVKFKQTEGELTDSIVVRQQLLDTDDYTPGETNSFEKDKKLTITLAQLTPTDKFQSGQNIDKSIDGDLSTVYHSPWSGMPEKPTIVLEYTLDPEDAEIMNYIVLYPRASGSNGIIKTATVWVISENDVEYRKVADIDVAMSNVPQIVDFVEPIIKPRKLKIEITDSYTHDNGKYYVSLAEIECYESKSINSIHADIQYFTDNTFSELNQGVTIDDISKITNQFIQNIAIYLLADEYPKEFRVQEYEPYKPIDKLSSELKTSSYNQYENPTGIYFTENQEVVVFVKKGESEKIALRVKDFGPTLQDNSYNLRDGLNVLTMKGRGNGYIDYFTSSWENSPKIKIHIASGKVNGYFDINKHSNEDGAEILENAVSEILDIKGNWVNLAYSVNSLKQNAKNELKDLIIMYDSIVGSQYTIMGLRKYNRTPKNHMFGRVIWDGYMHADGIGAAFHDNTMSNIANPNKLRSGIWGPAHEFGHVNQVRPGMKWVGTSECTNNIYSAWIQYCYTPNNLRLEHENIKGTIGGRFNAYLNNALIEGQEWGLQAGPDSEYGIKDNGKWGGDHFVKLAPLWQLQLYYHIAGEGNSWHKPYFWADIFEKVRNTNEASLSHGEMQINFVKNVCDAVQQDLSDFFIKVGILKEVDKYFDDYTSAQKVITQSMIDDAVTYVKKYPKPDTDVIFYISGNSIDAFKAKKQVTGLQNTGVTGTTTKQISHDTWKNVVVFETYKDNEISNITMVGTASANNTSTKVPYPSGSTKIMAVGYDGTRKLVCGQ